MCRPSPSSSSQARRERLVRRAGTSVEIPGGDHVRKEASNPFHCMLHNVASPVFLRRIVLVAAALCAVVLSVHVLAQTRTAEWTQFGGPHRDFTADVNGLATSWPAAGPA